MFNWKVHFDHEESPGDSKLMSIFIEVEFDDVQMKDILDIDGLFTSIVEDGFQPLFTCACGSFSCGGYYVKIVRELDGIRMINSYKPKDIPSESDLMDTFDFKMSWEDLYILSSSVYENILEVKENNPEYDFCSGSYGIRLKDNLDKYESILKCLRNRYEN
jgi:hypothetical protein